MCVMALIYIPYFHNSSGVLPRIFMGMIACVAFGSAIVCLVTAVIGVAEAATKRNPKNENLGDTKTN
jgi:hypothetical protein